jgi:SpoVK/Ycf46/Vps4 family AAA+-type ATPase
MDMQKQEMREAVELPLSHFDLYKQIGIDPPRSVPSLLIIELKIKCPLCLRIKHF